MSPDRLVPTRSGLLLLFGIGGLALSAVRSRNNLLLLLLGFLLALLVASTLVSRLTLGRISVERALPRRGRAGTPTHVHYTLRNRSRILPAPPLLLSEVSVPAPRPPVSFPEIPPGGSRTARDEIRFDRRGWHRREAVRLSTTFPFGFFRRERLVPLPGTILVWPARRSVRQVDPARPASGEKGVAPGGRGSGGEFRELRGFLVGDRLRAIHWPASLRTGETLARAFEEPPDGERWIRVKLRHGSDVAFEEELERAAALAEEGLRRGERVGLLAETLRIIPGRGEGQREAILDLLATLDGTTGETPGMTGETPGTTDDSGERPRSTARDGAEDDAEGHAAENSGGARARDARGDDGGLA